MTSRLLVDNIQGKATSGTVAIPGHIIQVTHVTKTDTATINSAAGTAFADTGLNCSITPKFASSLIMINASVCIGSSTGSFAYFRMMRNIAGGTYAMSVEPDADGARPLVHGFEYDSGNPGNGPNAQSFVAVESLNTTSVVNFKVQMGGSGTTDITLNKSSRDGANTHYDARSSSRIVLMEVAQ
tara:strand:+ start:20 stop:571 length:552 start_codon:yes stop_codon:yes gene_type:complete